MRATQYSANLSLHNQNEQHLNSQCAQCATPPFYTSRLTQRTHWCILAHSSFLRPQFSVSFKELGGPLRWSPEINFWATRIEERGEVVTRMMGPAFMTLALLLPLCHLGQSSHQHLEDHLTGQQHDSDHEINMLLGDKDTEELKKLSPSEQRKKMTEIVKKIDTNADNLLSADEIALWIQHVYRRYALIDAEERFPAFDTNKDGVVTWDEYIGQLGSFDESEMLPDSEQESVRHLHLKEKRRFDFADVDSLPGLNVTEFLAFIHPSEVDYMADFAVEDVLSEYDSDKDGFISLTEFIGDVRDKEAAPSQWEIEETVRFKDLYDQDMDGKLNREEQLRWVAPNSYGSAREEALHLITEIDHDEDGQISEAEVLKNQDTFMNSEVTDYGRQLHISHDEL